MGTRRNIIQFRQVPAPIGAPPVTYFNYSFVQMKPIHVVPYSVDLTVPLQPFVNVIIPNNAWVAHKLLYLKLGYEITLVAGHDTSIARFRQFYSADPTSPVFLGACSYDSPLPATGRGVLEFKFVRIDNNIFDWGSFELECTPLIGATIGSDRLLQCNGSVGVLDFTTQFEFKQLIDVLGALPGDMLNITWAQAYIQSALDLRRMPL